MEENQNSSKFVSCLPDVRRLMVLNPDGNYSRLISYPTILSSPDPNSSSSPVLSKDITINATKKTWLRLYLPRHLLLLESDNHHHHDRPRRVPLIVYYHGGGFIACPADSNICHDFCNFMSQRIEVVIASVDYRLAPEHRLPAAYEDAFEALEFIKSSEDDWLKRFADISSCFLMGSSSGGNISYQTGIRVCSSSSSSGPGPELEPLKVRGLVLHHPFFGGSERTESEVKLFNDRFLSMDVCDMLWELCLPVGSDRDHEYSNPMTSMSASSKVIREAGLRVLLLGAYGDPLIDRELQLTKTLQENGVTIATHFNDGFHGEDVVNWSKAHFISSILKDFISFNAKNTTIY